MLTNPKKSSPVLIRNWNAPTPTPCLHKTHLVFSVRGNNLLTLLIVYCVYALVCNVGSVAAVFPCFLLGFKKVEQSLNTIATWGIFVESVKLRK